MLSVLKKELWGYFGNYATYAILFAFALVCALFLWFFDNDYNVFNSEIARLDSFFFVAPWILLFLVPAITMKQFSEEKQIGTLDWLMTQPISLKKIILGKFFSVAIVLLLMIALTLFSVITLAHFSLNGIDTGVVFTAYLGLYLLALLFAAVGLMASTFFSQQVTAYIVAVFCNFVLFFGFQGIASYNLLGSLDYTLQRWGASFHYDGFLKGLIDTRDLIYFLGLIPVFLLISYVSLLKNKK
ncbi:ABC transporter permease subunit [Ornithobacterium rhinotracheale]|uniref:ABC transporter permease subunit n=1 Tax=Ornithobacterium rhinotracheale TaxID=28251 RepID=UPI0040366F6C